MPEITLLQIDSDGGPVACTLGGDDYRDRMRHLGALASRALLARESPAGRERLTFRDTPEVERDLRAALAAEAECCGFLAMTLRRTADGLVLDLSGPAPAGDLLSELFAP